MTKTPSNSIMRITIKRRSAPVQLRSIRSKQQGVAFRATLNNFHPAPAWMRWLGDFEFIQSVRRLLPHLGYQSSCCLDVLHSWLPLGMGRQLVIHRQSNPDSVCMSQGWNLTTPTKVPSKTRTQTQAFLTYVLSTLDVFWLGCVRSSFVFLALRREWCMLMVRPAIGLGRAPIVLTVVCAAAISTIVFVHRNQESEKEVLYDTVRQY